MAGYYLMPHPPIMVYEVGREETQKVQKTIESCRSIGQEIKAIQPETIIIITSHGPLFSDAIALSLEPSISGSLRQFGAPNVALSYDIDLELTKLIIDKATSQNIQTVGVTKKFLKYYNRQYELDHGSIVPLSFVHEYYQDYKLVHITYGMINCLDLYRFGLLIRDAIRELGRKVVVIASGDLSHRLSHDGPYSYSPKGKIFDETIIKYLEEGKTLEIFKMNKKDIEEAGECGYRSILILLGVLGKFKGQILSYEAPFGVGYAVGKFTSVADENLYEKLKENHLQKVQEKIINSDDYVKLVRQSLQYYFKHKRLMEVPKELPPEMLETRRGVFVSLKKEGSLRGCIGTFLPTTYSIAHEIIQNAYEAAFHDPRFPELTEDELDDIEISVDVLSEPTKANIEELDPKKYGIIVMQGKRRGLLLPDLEGVDTVSKQIAIACQKAGIDPNKHFEIEKFTVERHVEGGLKHEV